MVHCIVIPLWMQCITIRNSMQLLIMRKQEHYWDDTLRIFGKVLRHHRLKLKCSQANLSQQLGCTRSHLAMLESGKRIPNASLLKKLEQFTGLSIIEMATAAYTD